MIAGVNFQPGGGEFGEDPRQSGRTPGSGVQEAIKVLSLRLPKVVGAQGGTPQALLAGSGSQGNRVDSVVNQVLARMLPTGQPQATPMPHLAPQGPTVTGGASPQGQPPPMPSWPWGGPQTPKVIIGNPFPGDGPVPTPENPGVPGGGMIGELPPNIEDLLRQLGGGARPSPTPDRDQPLY